MKLAPLDLLRICPMCSFCTGQSQKPVIRYCRGVTPDERYARDNCKLGIEPPHFHRQCPRCKYEWQELALDEVLTVVPEFSEQWQCGACGFVGDFPSAILEFCGAGDKSQPSVYCCWPELADGEPHLHRICPVCAYKWPTKTVAAPLVIGVQSDD